MAYHPRGFVMTSDMPVVKPFMEFTARVLKKLYQMWIQDNKDVILPVYADMNLSVLAVVPAAVVPTTFLVRNSV